MKSDGIAPFWRLCAASLCLAIAGSVAAAGAEAGASCRVVLAATLQITLAQHHAVVPVTVDGQQLNLGIDTGAQGTSVTPEAAERLRLLRDPSHHTRMTGVGGTMIVNNVALSRVALGGVAYDWMSVAVLPLGPSNPTQGPAIDGLLGADILGDYDIALNIPARTLRLYRVRGCVSVRPPWPGRYASVPARITRTRRLALPLQIDGQAVAAIFDTGSTGERLALPAATRIGVTAAALEQDPPATGLGAGGRAYTARLHRFSELRIGDEVFHNPPIETADFPGMEADMLLGLDYMHARRFWLSYATHVIYIQTPAQSHSAATSSP